MGSCSPRLRDVTIYGDVLLKFDLVKLATFLEARKSAGIPLGRLTIILRPSEADIIGKVMTLKAHVPFFRCEIDGEQPEQPFEVRGPEMENIFCFLGEHW